MCNASVWQLFMTSNKSHVFKVQTLSRRLHQMCGFLGFGPQCLAHGEEFSPVGAEATGVHTCVDDEAPDETASRFVPQSDSSLALRYVVADVDQLQHQQVKQSSGDDAAVPGTGEAQGRAGQTHRVRWQTICHYTVWGRQLTSQKLKVLTPRLKKKKKKVKVGLKLSCSKLPALLLFFFY